MAVLLKDALKPNLVQTLENNPAFIHGGPFANIAHGCNSVIATKLAMRLADYTVTEAGFGADLGAEKFIEHQVPQGGHRAQRRGDRGHRPGAEDARRRGLKDLTRPNLEALDKGVENLKKHIENIHRFGLPVVVAINSFATDTEEEIDFIQDKCAYLRVKIVQANHWARGGEGAEDLARAVVDGGREHQDRLLACSIPTPARCGRRWASSAGRSTGATDVLADKKLRDKFQALQDGGFGHLPICMAKTQYSLSTDPALKGRPKRFDVPCAT